MLVSFIPACVQTTQYILILILTISWLASADEQPDEWRVTDAPSLQVFPV